MIDDLDLDEFWALIDEPHEKKTSVVHVPEPLEEPVQEEIVPPVSESIPADRKVSKNQDKERPVSGGVKQKVSQKVKAETSSEKERHRKAPREVPEVREVPKKKVKKEIPVPEPVCEKDAAPPDKKRSAKGADWKISIPFFTVILALMIVSFLIPLRPTTSMSERRSLASFPEFSLKSLVQGEYFSGINEWFSDTFPGRDSWIEVSNRIDHLHGISTIAINYSPTALSQESTSAESGETGDAAAETLEAEPQEVERVEITAVEEDPEEILETVSDEELIEMGGLQNNQAAEITLGKVIQIDDSCYNYFSFSDEFSERHAQIINDIYDIVSEKGVRLFDMLVPDSLGILYSPEFVEQIGSSNYEEALDYVYGLENEGVGKVNLYQTLVSHSDEYIYFRTDHHWTALGAYYAYTKWCELSGFEPVSLDAYTTVDMGIYHGSFFNKAPNSDKLTEDTLIGYLPPGDLMTVIDTGDGKFVADAVRDLTHSPVNVKYQAFICGDNALTVITNNDLPDGPNCLIIQDSFGNPFCVYLAQHYHKVYIVDYREGYLTFSRFIENHDISDIIIEEYLGFIQGSDTNYLIRQMVK